MKRFLLDCLQGLGWTALALIGGVGFAFLCKGLGLIK